jgi:hypothetical protein
MVKSLSACSVVRVAVGCGVMVGVKVGGIGDGVSVDSAGVGEIDAPVWQEENAKAMNMIGGKSRIRMKGFYQTKNGIQPAG